MKLIIIVLVLSGCTREVIKPELFCPYGTIPDEQGISCICDNEHLAIGCTDE